MKFRKLTLLSFVLISMFVLSACDLLGASAEDIAGDVAEDVLTIAAMTIEAELTANAAGESTATPEAGAQPEGEVAAVPAPATFTPVPEVAPPPAPTQTPGAVGCTDIASFVADLTVPDGTEFAPNAGFTKTWRLANAGTCTWTSGYEIIFDSGDAMGGPAAQQLTGGTVAPGGTVDVSIPQTAPGSIGTYRGNYRLRNASGIIFALSNGNPFYVEIAVVAPGGGGLVLIPGIVVLSTPTPTPSIFLIDPVIIVPLLNADFASGYIGGLWQNTNGNWIVTFIVENTGNVALESLSMKFQDPPGNQVSSFTSNSPFRTSPNQPTNQAGADTLAIGDTSWLNVILNYHPSGSVRAIIKLCSQDALQGVCKEVPINVTV